LLLDLLKFREVALFKQLTGAISQKTKVEKKNQFEVLMYEVSDLV
jgi:Acyl-CoA oxidase